MGSQTYSGNLRKLKSKHVDPIQYWLPLNDIEIPLNECLGRSIKLQFQGIINCVACGAKTKKSFAQGFCYRCFISRPETEEDVLHPEKCKAHLGIARDMEWAKENCLIPHHVYLADTSQLKVGVTRMHQTPTRWIDQGALQSIGLALTPNRYLAGMIEISLKAHVADKTQWKKMLSNNTFTTDLLESKRRIAQLIPEEYKQYLNTDDTINTFSYPKVSEVAIGPQVNFDKDPFFEGTLVGIKGQYLLFASGHVFNVRKHGGYQIEIQIS